MSGMRAARMAALCLALVALRGCARLGGVFSGSVPEDSRNASPAASSASGAERPSLLPLLSPEGERKLMEARSLWIEDDCVEPERATLLLDAVLEEVPDYADALIWRGKALTAQGYLEDAFDDLTMAVRLLPGGGQPEGARLRARAYAARAYTALRMAREQGAERDLASALEADPSEPTVYLYRGALEFLRGKDAEGCADLGRACALGMCGARQQAESGGLCR